MGDVSIPRKVATIQANAKSRIHLAIIMGSESQGMLPFDELQGSLFGGLARPMVKRCHVTKAVDMSIIADREPHLIDCKACLNLYCKVWGLPVSKDTEPDDLLVLSDLAEESGLLHLALSLRWCSNTIRVAKKRPSDDDLPPLGAMFGMTARQRGIR